MITELTNENYENFVNAEGITVVDFLAPWCGPCKVLSPIVDQLAIEFNMENKGVHIGKINVDENRDKAVELGVISIPTILIYKDGEIVERNTGMIQKGKLKELIENHF